MMKSIKSIFSRNKISNEYQKENEHILELIYDKAELKWNEGKFNPSSWIRPANLTNDGENESIITDFAGISISYDVVIKSYELSIPVKFSSIAVQMIYDLISNIYDVKKFNKLGYTKTIYFTKC